MSQETTRIQPRRLTLREEFIAMRRALAWVFIPPTLVFLASLLFAGEGPGGAFILTFMFAPCWWLLLAMLNSDAGHGGFTSGTSGQPVGGTVRRVW